MSWRCRSGDRVVKVTVAGIYYDYSTERGWVIFDNSTLAKYLPHQPPTNLAIYVRKEADATQVRRAVEARLAKYRVVVAPNRALRQNAVVIFDRTFAITYALEGVAIAVAMLGAANSLLAMVLDRRREFGLLRYLGAAPAQVRRMILLEAGFLGRSGECAGPGAGLRAFAGPDLRDQQTELRVDHPISPAARIAGRRVAACACDHSGCRHLSRARRCAAQSHRSDS